MVYKFEVQIAAAQDKGARVEMEGTETLNNSSAKVLHLICGKTGLNSMLMRADIHVVKQDAWQDKKSSRRCSFLLIFRASELQKHI